MPQDLEMTRSDGVVVVERLRGWGWGVAFILFGVLFLFMGLFCLLTGQHFPQLSSLATALWSALLGVVLTPWGIGLTRNGERFSFSQSGLRVDFFRLRAMHWFVDYPIPWIQGIYIEGQIQGRVFRVMVEIANRPDVELAEHLSGNEAWELASAIAEPAMLSIEER